MNHTFLSFYLYQRENAFLKHSSNCFLVKGLVAGVTLSQASKIPKVFLEPLVVLFNSSS
jgi:hypothetical protein